MTHKILITGGAGYIGSHTAVALHEAGFTPVIVDNFVGSDQRALDGIAAITGAAPTFYHGDCTDAAFMADVFAREAATGTPIAGVIHFAAHKAVGESVAQPVMYYKNNLNSLLALLEVVSAQDTPCPVIFSSSATVYGDAPAESMPLTEDTPRRAATNPYGNTKAIAEDILHDAVAAPDSTLTAIALRYFNPVGAHPSALIGERPSGTPNNLVPYLTQAAAKKRGSLTVFGDDYDTPDGTGVRDYIHVCDLADAHVAALTYALAQDAAMYDVFNIGTGRGTSVTELITTFERATGVSVPYTVGPRRVGDIATCYADTTKAADVLGWRATHTIADALIDAWRWEQKCN